MMMFPQIPMLNYEVVVIGGGPAGMAAARKAGELGLRVLLLNENPVLGENLRQCDEKLASELAEGIKGSSVDFLTSARVIEIGNYSDMEKAVVFTSPEGTKLVWAKAIIYTAGTRERHAFEAGIIGDRGAGVYTVGEARGLISYGALPGRKVVVSGSNDSALALAVKLAEKGAVVAAVVEEAEYAIGSRDYLSRLSELGARIYTGSKVSEVRGLRRVERVKVVKPNGEVWIDADTLIVGIEPVPAVKKLVKLGAEIDPATKGPVVNELLETTIPGIFVAGSALMAIYDPRIAMDQGELAACGAKEFVENGGIRSALWIPVEAGENVLAVIPQRVSGEKDAHIYLRVSKPVKEAGLRIPEIGKKTGPATIVPSEVVKTTLRKEEIEGVRRITVEVV